jgi:hypothetical protein
MKPRAITRTALLLLACALAPAAAYAEDVEEIMDKFDKVARDSYSSAISQIKLSTCKYRIQNDAMKCIEKPREVIVETVQKDYGPRLRDSRTLAGVIAPISDKGISTLTYDYEQYDREKDMWLYLPALGKVKRLISNSDGGENFFGSEFLTENMENRKLRDYSHKIIGETDYNNRPVWIVELLPTDEKLKKSPFSKIESFIDKERYLPVKENFYNHGGQLYLQQVWLVHEKVDGVWIGRKVSMNNFISQRVSHLATESVKFQIDVSDEFFTQRSLTDFAYRESRMGQLRALYSQPAPPLTRAP